MAGLYRPAGGRCATDALISSGDLEPPTIFVVCVNGGPGSDESGRTRKEIGPGVMEILIVLGSVAALATAVWVPWALLLEGGAALAAFGLLIGVPTGLAYHLKLRACLLERAALPARWWLAPVRLHARLDTHARRRVLPWFYAGGLGFLITTLGLVLALLSLPGCFGLVARP